MIRFDLDEIPREMPTFYAQLSRQKATKPPGRWRPYFKLAYVTLQDEETDKWVGWVKWQLFEGKGAYPCRDANKGETISRTDPPDYWPTEAAAGQFAGQCVTAIREQYNEWIQQDFFSKERET